MNRSAYRYFLLHPLEFDLLFRSSAISSKKIFFHECFDGINVQTNVFFSRDIFALFNMIIEGTITRILSANTGANLKTQSNLRVTANHATI
jgi:hypothetical protein